MHRIQEVVPLLSVDRFCLNLSFFILAAQHTESFFQLIALFLSIEYLHVNKATSFNHTITGNTRQMFQLGEVRYVHVLWELDDSKTGDLIVSYPLSLLLTAES